MSQVERQHLRRRAYVYVRQSTMAQVKRNAESRERQYELVERAVALGWPASEVVVVDADQGQSAKSADGRDGFQGLVAEVGLGWVGIVLGIKVSRLARSSVDEVRATGFDRSLGGIVRSVVEVALVAGAADAAVNLLMLVGDVEHRRAQEVEGLPRTAVTGGRR